VRRAVIYSFTRDEMVVWEPSKTLGGESGELRVNNGIRTLVVTITLDDLREFVKHAAGDPEGT